MDYKKITRESYDTNVGYNLKYFASQFNPERRPEFKKMLGLIPRNRILDIGCGTGEHALYFEKFGMKVTCIDFSNEMVKLCKERGLNAVIMDMEDLIFEDESFDGIWSVTSLIHLKKKRVPKVVSKIHDLLSTKGILYVSMIEGKGEGLFDDPYNSGTKRFKALWEKEEFARLFEHGFEMIEFRNPSVNDRRYLEFFFRKK